MPTWVVDTQVPMISSCVQSQRCLATKARKFWLVTLTVVKNAAPFGAAAIFATDLTSLALLVIKEPKNGHQDVFFPALAGPGRCWGDEGNQVHRSNC